MADPNPSVSFDPQQAAPIALRVRLVGPLPREPGDLLRTCALVEPVPSPRFTDLLEEYGARREGPRTFVLPRGKARLGPLFWGLLAPLRLHLALPGSDSEPERLRPIGASQLARRLGIHGTPGAPPRRAVPLDGPAFAASMVVLGRVGPQLGVTIATGGPGLQIARGTPDLGVLGLRGRSAGSLVTPDLATALLDTAAGQGFEITDEEGDFAALCRALAGAVVVHAVPGAPGLARVVVGTDAPGARGVRRLRPLLESRRLATAVVSAPVAAEVAAALRSRGACPVAIDPSVVDATRMALAEPSPADGLLAHQWHVVAVHRATRSGFVNASATGLGKTVTTLVGCRERAQERGRYRVLVVVPAHLREQWRGEATKHFPQAEVVVLVRGADAARGLPDPERAGAVVVIVSHTLATRAADTLAALEWDELVCDEAEILRSGGSARTRALWALRERAGVAVALTATPVVRSIDDVRRIAAWAQGDRAILPEASATEWPVRGARAGLGPVLLRPPVPDSALPSVRTEVVRIAGDPAELRLAEVARTRLKAMARRIRAQIDAAARLDADDPAIARIRRELARTRGALLGQVTVARMAASDPLAVAQSNAAAARLLAAGGHVEAALRAGGTKRRRVTAVAADLHARGEAVIVFSEFVASAQALARDLHERGVPTGLVTGASAGRARAVHAFQHGETGVLICTAAGQEGLNLQRASVVIHFDLPWLFSAVEQRVGRAARIGSDTAHVEVLVPLMQGTIEERVLERLTRRGAEALLALDAQHASASPIKGSLRGLGMAVRDRPGSGLRGLLADIEELL